jgi:drug/metabolite transporter (DMT)-like permease
MRRKGVPILTGDGSGRAGVAVGIVFGLEFCFVNFGLHFTAASRLVVFLYLAPFVVAIGMPFIASTERLNRTQTVGLVAAFAALAFAFEEGLVADDALPLQWLGDTLAIGGGILWGATTLMIRATRLSTAAPERTLFFQLAVSAPVLLLVAALAGESLPAATVEGAASMLFQAVLVAFASYLIWFWLLRHYPATRVSAFTFLTPVSALLFGALLLGEPITTRLLVALAGVALGIQLVNRRSAPRGDG